MEFEFLQSLVLIFGISALVVFALGRAKIPSLVGFLVAGVILGPHGFQFIKDVREVEVLAEIGVILLMFTIGLELSLKNLMALRRAVLGGGLVQVSLTTLVVMLLSALLLHQKLSNSMFDGFLVALSSTAIVMKLLMDRGEMSAPYGRTSLGILIFQDLCVIPFMLLTPILAGGGGSFGHVLLTMGKAFFVIAAVLLSARWTVPFILHQVVSTRSRELFVITIILLCAGTALLTMKLGLSLALGAFLAGIIISESDYASQAISDILPFKESFTGLFFISVGMLMDVGFFTQNALSVVSVVLIILAVKLFTGLFAGSVTGHPLRVSIQTGLSLSQIGEFSFVLALVGRTAGLLSEYIYQMFLSASVLTMLLTPFIFSAAPSVSGWLALRFPLRRIEQRRLRQERAIHPVKKSGHVIVVGFGVNGSNLARVLKKSEIPYVILEMNANTVQKAKKKGEPIYYGDGTSAEILHKLGIHSARMIVVAISDPAATRRIVQVARHENPEIHILVRTRYVAEVDDLLKLGANEVIPEEFETSVEIFSRVLHHYHIPRNLISSHITEVRQASYHVLRSVELPKKKLPERCELLPDIETEAHLVTESSAAAGKSLRELALRAKTGVTVIAAQRNGKLHQNPGADFVLHAGDSLVLVGRKEDLDTAVEYLESQ